MKSSTIKKSKAYTFGKYVGNRFNKIYFNPDELTMLDKEFVLSLFKRMTIRNHFSRENTYMIETKDVEYHINKYNDTYVIRDFTNDIFYIFKN